IWQLAPDGSAVFGRRGLQIYRVPLNGSPAWTLLSTLPNGEGLKSLAVTPDGARLLFVSEGSGLSKLRSAPSTGGPTELLAATTVAGSNSVRDVQVAPDSQHVVYEMRTGPGEVFELFLDRPDGTRYALRLNASLPPGGTVKSSLLVG